MPQEKPFSWIAICFGSFLGAVAFYFIAAGIIWGADKLL